MHVSACWSEIRHPIVLAVGWFFHGNWIQSMLPYTHMDKLGAWIPEGQERSKETFFSNMRRENLDKKDIQQLQKAYAYLKRMRRGKRRHSEEVAVLAAQTTQDIDTLVGALLHDLKEQSPKQFKKAKKHISDRAKAIVEHLSEGEGHEHKKNAPLAHLREVFAQLDQEDINELCIVKLCDRLHNIRKRAEANSLRKGYKNKSDNLFRFLAESYQADDRFDEQALLVLGDQLSEVIGCENYLVDRILPQQEEFAA